MTPEQEQEIIFEASFGQPYTATKDLNGVPVQLRTLFDYEIFDCIKRANKHPEFNERDFDQNRWKLAYSLIAVNERILPEALEEKYKIICNWLNIYVALLITTYDELVQEEIELVTELKKNLQ